MSNLRTQISSWISAILLCGSAEAHEWYDAWCCNTRDCSAIPVKNVQIKPDGYHVQLRIGDHPMVTGNRSYIIPFSGKGILVSQDNDYHICLRKDKAQSFRCFYAPTMGF